MSDVILKIGEDTNKVDQNNIRTVSIGDTPRVNIKYAEDHSVVIYTRNPLHVTITDTDTIPDVCTFLSEFEKSGDEKYLEMALNNIESRIGVYVSQNLFSDVSLSIIEALKNSKRVGRRQASQSS